jgi:Maf1 regulator
MNTIDTTLYNLRPRPLNSFLMVPGITPGSACPPSSQTNWGPSMWRLIDQQMSLKECSIYRYAPDDLDPFEDEDEGAIWSINYFFFNKTRKRVCYLYLRGLSVLSHSARDSMQTPIKSKRLADDESDGWLTPDLGARKRARYWLGDREGFEIANHDDSDTAPTKKTGLIASSEERSDEEQFGPPTRPVVDENDNYILSDEDARSARSASKSTIRGISEEIVGTMDI